MDAQRKKLFFQSHHMGTKENDFLLGRYAVYALEGMSEEELTVYAALLNYPDPDIHGWIMGGKKDVPAEVEPLVTSIRIFHGL